MWVTGIEPMSSGLLHEMCLYLQSHLPGPHCYFSLLLYVRGIVFLRQQGTPFVLWVAVGTLPPAPPAMVAIAIK